MLFKTIYVYIYAYASACSQDTVINAKTNMADVCPLTTVLLTYLFVIVPFIFPLLIIVVKAFSICYSLT